MAYIKVNYIKIVEVASQIDEYIFRYKKNMKNMDSAMNLLNSSWKGVDYNEVKKEWEEINASGSTSDKMLCDLKDYVDSLRLASDKYKSAQSRAINRANIFCK